MPKQQLSPQQQAIVANDQEAMLSSILVRAICGGRGVTTFHRWRHDPDPDRRFPEPDMYLGSVPYWRRKTVVGWLDRQAARRDARRQAVLANARKAQAARGA